MSIWWAKRCRIQAAAGIALALGVAAGAVGVAGPAQARPVLKLPPRSAAVSWGDNQDGQLGNGSTTASATYAGVSGLGSGVAQVSAGHDDNSMALTTDGTVWTWGVGKALGTGSSADSTVPVQVPGLTRVTQISAGSDFDLALRSDGTVWAWGDNSAAELGDGNTGPGPTPVQVTGLTGVTQIATGHDYSLALRSDGTVWGWGSNVFDQLGTGASLFAVVPVQVAGLSGVTQIAAGWWWGMAVRVQIRRGSAVSTVWTWGSNRSGQLGDGTTVSTATPVEVSGVNAPSIAAIATGRQNSMVLGSDGSVWTWGAGDLGDGTPNIALRPVRILDGGVTGIAAGQSHALALLRGGNVLAWGDGLFGSGTSSLTPVPVPSLAGVTQISAGDDYSLAVHQVVLVFAPRGAPGTPRR
jgi:alpha-tubulin suppressor-like RCC1 family protein